MTTVLITGARAPVAQDLARAFGSAGFAVHLADSVDSWAARALRPRASLHRVPPPRQAFAAFRSAMAALIAEVDPELVVPTCEEVFWLAEAAAQDGWADVLYAPPLATLRRLHSKAEFPEFAATLGLDVPETRAIASVDELPAAAEGLVLKPEYSRFGTRVLVGPSAAQCARISPTPEQRWVVQRRAFGEEVSSWAAVRAGQLVAYAAYRPRWRKRRGAAFQFEAVDIPAVRRVSEAVADATGMTGHLGFDLIVDADGRAWPIECNPRAVSGLHLFDAAPALAEAIAGAGICPPPPPGRLRHLAPAMLLLGGPSALASGQIGELVADWKAGRDVVSRPRNRLPLLGCVADAARFALVALGKGLSPAEGTTADIEWDGQAIK